MPRPRSSFAELGTAGASPPVAHGRSSFSQLGQTPTSTGSEPAPINVPGPPPHHGTLVGNLLHGAVDAVASIPDTVTAVGGSVGHDVAAILVPAVPGHGPPPGKANETYTRVIKPALADLGYRYGPLTHGEFGLFYKRFHADPFATIMDAATIASIGVGRVAALATLPKGATRAQVARALRTGELQGPRRVITARLSPDSEPIPVRAVPTKAYRAGRVIATDKALKKLPPSTPGLGEFSRAARATKREALPTLLRHQHSRAKAAYTVAFNRLTVAERSAANAIPRWPKIEDAQAALANLAALGREDSALAQTLGNPAVWKAYTERPKNVMAAVEAGRTLAHAREEILLRTGAITPETVAEAPFRHTRMARGATPLAAARAGPPPGYVRLYRGEGKTAPINPELNDFYGEGTEIGGWFSAQKFIADRYAKRNNGSVYYVDLPEADARPWSLNKENDKGEKWVEYRFPAETRDRVRAQMRPVSELEKDGPTLVGGPSVEELRAEFDAAGLPQPYYLQDIAETKGGGAAQPTGRTPPRPGADVHQSKGVLAETGKLLLHPDTTGPSFIRAAKHEWYLKTHEIVKRIAVRVPEEDGLPTGHKWVRETRGQKIPYLATVAGENMAELEDALRALPEQQPFTLHAGEGEDLAAKEGGFRLAVPDQFARAMDAEFRQSRRTIDFLERYPMALWRALVLKVRIPWLIGNILGNAVLATLRFAGRHGLAAVLSMIRTTKGGEAVRRALRLGVEKGGLTVDDIAALYPELERSGTFIGANVPGLGSERLIRLAPTRLEPTLRRFHRFGSALVDFLPHLDRATEGAFRRAGANKVLANLPEVKALRKQGLSPREAMIRASEQSEDVRRLVVKEVNDGLGDYLSMSHAEKTHVRALIPFYAWLREITRITLRLPLDYPGRVAILAHLAVIGQEQRAGRPSFLSGLEATGPAVNGAVPGVNATPWNPLNSGVDTLAALGTLAVHPTRRGASSLLGSLNPAVPAVFQYLEKARQGEKVPDLGLLLAALSDVGNALPEARVGTNPPSPLYPGRTREDLLKQFFGDPRRNVSVPVEQKYAREGR